jgi:hypothetical protein
LRPETAFRRYDGGDSSTSRPRTRLTCFSFRHIAMATGIHFFGASRRRRTGLGAFREWGSPACLGGKRVRLSYRQAGLKRRPLGFLGGSRREHRVSVSTCARNCR